MDNLVKNKIIAVIPARGGSKRIPNKNIIKFGGKPMIAYTIEAAIKSDLFDRIIVSTESKEIAKISIDYGAEVPFLREKYYNDFSQTSQATIYTVKKASKYFNQNYDTVFQLMANCPFRNSNDIIDAWNFFNSSNHNFQISCFKYGWVNPWWACKLDSKNNPTPIFPDDIRNNRSQDLPEVYCPTGAIWIAKTDKLIKQGTFHSNGQKFYPISLKSAMDIDDYDDLEMAKLFLKKNE